MQDLVNKPDHYNQGGIECIDAIEASLSEEAFQGYLKGNAIKYLWRWDQKNTDPLLQLQDLRKASWYLSRLATQVERNAEE